MPDRANVQSTAQGLVGALVGGSLGFLAFRWAYSQGFYAMILPGALLGLGCGLLAQHRSIPRGIVCGVAALLLGLYTEWQYFESDDSFLYMLTHVYRLRPLTLGMIGLGTAFAFWFGKDAGFRRGPKA